MSEVSYTDLAESRPLPSSGHAPRDLPDGAGLFIGAALGVTIWGAIFAFILW